MLKTRAALFFTHTVNTCTRLRVHGFLMLTELFLKYLIFLLVSVWPRMVYQAGYIPVIFRA